MEFAKKVADSFFCPLVAIQNPWVLKRYVHIKHKAYLLGHGHILGKSPWKAERIRFLLSVAPEA